MAYYHQIFFERQYIMDKRQRTLHEWLKTFFSDEDFSIKPLAGDASFRRYFRVTHQNKSYVLMDAPPEKEALTPFIDICTRLKNNHIHTPALLNISQDLGLLLLEDFGDALLLDCLKNHPADGYYQAAINVLHQIQRTPYVNLPRFDATFMLQEMQLMTTWFLQGHLKLDLSNDELDMINTQFHWIASQLSHQPTVFIHRDYHARNIMVLPEETLMLGIIDFQDAMIGPCTYDLVSLLKDCYIQWPRDNVLSWVQQFYQGLPTDIKPTLEQFIHDFDLCGLQRHLKVLGIFSRLNLRDHKPGYLKDLPLTLDYTLEALSQLPECRSFYDWMKTRVKLS